MGHQSTPQFTTLHALRIKGFATIETLTDMTALGADDVQSYLDVLAAAGHAQFREARSLWQLTPDGRSAYPDQLGVDVDGVDVPALLGASYVSFLELNTEFKTLCGDWQLRNDEINDHSDAAYDAAVIDRLTALDARVQPIVDQLGGALDRLGPYGPRLTAALGRVQGGESNLFTGVMCGSYHDAWMELHEDLILTQGIDRNAEGSF